MIFNRSIPPRRYRDYTRYRALLRSDFRHRCAYCLTHEHYVGGEAGCTIDHYRPRRGPCARPDLESDYANLYWACRECNENKGTVWPDPEDEERGIRFIDPCTAEGDHDLRWRTSPDGALEAITPAGEYTVEHLKLWRDQLVHHRKRVYNWQLERDELVDLLARKRMSAAMRTRLETRLVDLTGLLEPPVFDRPRTIDARTNQAG